MEGAKIRQRTDLEGGVLQGRVGEERQVERLLGRGVPVKMALNHGVSLSFYFDDPEGHLIEVYWPTGVVCRPCHGDPINLTLSEEALRRHLAELGAGAGTPITADGAEPGRS